MCNIYIFFLKKQHVSLQQPFTLIPEERETPKSLIPFKHTINEKRKEKYVVFGVFVCGSLKVGMGFFNPMFV